MSDVVLDASAVLALLFDEAGASIVREATGTPAQISSVNLAEVVTRMLERGASELETRARIGILNLEVNVLGERAAYLTGFLGPRTRAAGLSLGDRACIALARDLGLPVLTADRNWARIDLGVELELIR